MEESSYDCDEMTSKSSDEKENLVRYGTVLTNAKTEIRGNILALALFPFGTSILMLTRH